MSATLRVIGLVLLVATFGGGFLRADEKPTLKIHIISGSSEYKSEASLKELQTFLEKTFRVQVTASWGKDSGTSLDNLDALKSAELMIVFARRLKLPAEQMKLIRAHWDAGKPVIGIRTAGHAFQTDDNEVFDKQVLGGHYKGHYGSEAVKVTNEEKRADHPVLKDVKPFTSSKLYSAGPLGKDAVVLQTGDIGKANHPVTIVNTYKGGRTFFTSLGVPEDFKDENFRRLLLNAIFWTTKQDETNLKK